MLFTLKGGGGCGIASEVSPVTSPLSLAGPVGTIVAGSEMGTTCCSYESRVEGGGACCGGCGGGCC